MSDETASAESARFRSQRIASVVAQCLRRRAAGESISGDAVIAAHPELMPQLGEELRKLRLIWEAQRKAEQSPDNVGEVRGKISDGPSDPQSSTTSSDFDASATEPHIHSTTPDQRHRRLQKASRIGPYEILRTLGEGGYGIVFLAKDVDLERPVAIKVAKEGGDRSSEQVAAFLGEARRVAQLKHPSIVNVFDVSRGDADAWYLVMEYIEGPTLADVFAEGQLSTVALVELLVQIADAIHYAHSNGILHRDLKPSNVLLDKKHERPHIVDFGMALHEREQICAPRCPVGTPYCMAPEQVRGETHRLDARTDIWSLGVMMYQGLTGKRPFSGEDVNRLFEVILQIDPEPLSHVNPCVPAELERICLKCLSKRMGDRYATAADFATDLRRWVTDSTKVLAGSVSAIESREAAADAASKAQVVPRGLRSFRDEDAGFFLDLLPGPRNREGLPESVHSWVRALENRERRPERAVSVLYGPTGSGKSSFVCAGLLPRLNPSTSTICVDAATDNLEQDILSQLHRVCPNLPTRVVLAQACALIRRGSALQSPGKVLIVLDQFEQWLHANNSCLSGELVTALRQCDGERLQCLIIVRSDFWLGTTRFMRELELPLVEGCNSAHLDLFDARHARKVLTLFGQSYGCLPRDRPLDDEHDQFLDQAVQQISRDGWVMPVRLALFADMIRGQEWNSNTLKKLGGERGVGVAFLEQAFSSSLSAPNHRRFRRAAEAALRALLPEPGVDIKGRSRTQIELLQACGYENKTQQFAELMDILDSQLRLITPTEASEATTHRANGAGSSASLPTYQPSFQLTHDYLVPALREWLTRGQQSTRTGRAQLCLEQRAKQWQREPVARSLPSLGEALRICVFTSPRSWTAPQASMTGKAFSHHLRRGAILALTAVVLSGLLYSLTPPEPLPIFLDASNRTTQRIEAFDRLNLSDISAMGQVLGALRDEKDARVLEHVVGRLSRFAQRLKPSKAGHEDSVHEKIVSDMAELLRRDDRIADRHTEDEIRSVIFETCAALAPPPAVLQLGVYALDRTGTRQQQALTKYLQALDVASLIAQQRQTSSSNDTQVEATETVVALVQLIDDQPEGAVREAAADCVAALKPDQIVELFIAAFAGEMYGLAEKSAAIYVSSLPDERRRVEATRLLAALQKELTRQMRLVSEEHTESPDTLEYVLTSIRLLQPSVDVRNDALLGQVRHVLDERAQFRKGSVIDVACGAYAAMYRVASKERPFDLAALLPLQAILHDDQESFDVRCAAAESLGDTGDLAAVNDLATVALSPNEELRLRTSAVEGLAAIGRAPLGQNRDTQQVADALLRLFDVDRYQSGLLLQDVAYEYANIAPLDDLSHVLALLSLREHNFSAQRAIYPFLLRFPDSTERIARETLVAVAALTDEQKKTLFPGPGSILAEIPQVHASYGDEAIFTTCRRLAVTLAETSATHADRAVRILAYQNLQRLLTTITMPTIDPATDSGIREQQLAAWQRAWIEIEPRLILNEAIQLEVR